MKSEDGNPIPGKYIILSAFPGVTATDRRASEWGDDFAIVIPNRRHVNENKQIDLKTTYQRSQKKEKKITLKALQLK